MYYFIFYIVPFAGQHVCVHSYNCIIMFFNINPSRHGKRKFNCSYFYHTKINHLDRYSPQLTTRTLHPSPGVCPRSSRRKRPRAIGSISTIHRRRSSRTAIRSMLRPRCPSKRATAITVFHYYVRAVRDGLPETSNTSYRGHRAGGHRWIIVPSP